MLLRWRRSLWKLVWKDLLLYICLYVAISLVYRLALSDEQAEAFESLIRWVRKNSSQLPLTFMLGFYVKLVVERWWGQYVHLPWPDDVASYSKVAIMNDPKKEAGDDETNDNENLKIRKTIVRYCLLSYVLCLRRISSRLRQEYPSMEHLVTASLVRKDEAAVIGEENPEDMKSYGGSNWWLPIKWSIDIIGKAQVDGRIQNPVSYQFLVGKVCDFRKQLEEVAAYSHTTIPLIYTQVVHLAVYIYFGVQLVGSQWIRFGKEGEQELGPVFLIFKFLFYFGWLNVAVNMYNPFGCDDEDFHLLDLLNRHIKVAPKLVDEGNDFPEVRDDEFGEPLEVVKNGVENEHFQDNFGFEYQIEVKAL